MSRYRNPVSYYLCFESNGDPVEVGPIHDRASAHAHARALDLFDYRLEPRRECAACQRIGGHGCPRCPKPD